jgi:hypothetical protein
MQHGHGRETWPDGSSYDGYYEQGKKHGQGTYVFSNGSVYNGGWKDNMMEGVGTFTWRDGRRWQARDARQVCV